MIPVWFIPFLVVSDASLSVSGPALPHVQLLEPILQSEQVAKQFDAIINFYLNTHFPNIKQEYLGSFKGLEEGIKSKPEIKEPLLELLQKVVDTPLVGDDSFGLHRVFEVLELIIVSNNTKLCVQVLEETKRGLTFTMDRNMVRINEVASVRLIGRCGWTEESKPEELTKLLLHERIPTFIQQLYAQGGEIKSMVNLLISQLVLQMDSRVCSELVSPSVNSKMVEIVGKF